ncbi:MAG: DNA repair protein RecO [Lachnospiraceae bacterium]|nr:DNA repair protein RecO [Lachnospiraceae bacterium]
MREDEVLSGMVLYAADQGEYGKRLVVLTKECGKVTMFANNARKPNNPLVAVCRIFATGSFTVRRGRDSYTLFSADISEWFSGFEKDIEKFCYASYLCEFMSYYTHEGEYSKDFLNLLFVAVKAVEKGEVDVELVRRVFELKTMMLAGEGPNVFGCVSCADREGQAFFSVSRGGVLCEACGRLAKDAVRISPTVAYTLKYIAQSPLTELFSFSLKSDALEEFGRLAAGFVKRYVDREFKSLEILNGIV